MFGGLFFSFLFIQLQYFRDCILFSNGINGIYTTTKTIEDNNALLRILSIIYFGPVAAVDLTDLYKYLYKETKVRTDFVYG